MNKKVRELNKQNNLLDKQIKEENQEAFTDMICYLRGADISEYDIETVRQDITEMVLSAQERGENIQSVIGGDYKEFCDSIIANLPHKTAKQKAAEVLDIICWGLSILFLINILVSGDTVRMLQSLINGTPAGFNISVSAGTLVSMAFILAAAWTVVNLVTKNAFSREITHRKTLGFFVGAGFMIILIGIHWFGKKILFTVNIFAALVLTAALFAAHKLIENI
ncbi:MAG: hypothetical protein ACI4LO_07570 [Anaerovoracaceae bacterium]